MAWTLYHTLQQWILERSCKGWRKHRWSAGFGNYAASAVRALCCPLTKLHRRTNYQITKRPDIYPKFQPIFVQCNHAWQLHWAPFSVFLHHMLSKYTSTSGKYLLRVWGNAGSQSRVHSEILYKCWSNSGRKNYIEVHKMQSILQLRSVWQQVCSWLLSLSCWTGYFYFVNPIWSKICPFASIYTSYHTGC